MAQKHKKPIDHLKKLGRLLHTSKFAQRYLVFAIVILAVTTLFWSIIGSLIHLDNADQLVNSYLLQNPQTFYGAVFPDQHTFLLKLPVFWLIQLLGSTPLAFTVVTVLVVTITVGLLGYILYRIEKRPLILGTILLALAASLMLIPAQPYAGALLPVNMAMVTTRNLEYILFIVSLVYITRSKSFRDKNFLLSCAAMTLLIASDKLFLSLSIGGAVLALITYIFAGQKELIRLSLKWLAVSVVGFISATALLVVLNGVGFMHTSSSIGIGPYGSVHTMKDFVIGLIYGVAGVFTNFGANPAFDANIIQNIPHQLFSRLFSVSGVSFVITFIITIVILVSVYKTLIHSILEKAPSHKRSRQNHSLVALMLVWTSIAAGGVFVLSNHYYPVDARYLTIVLFAGFITLASFLYKRKIPPYQLVISGSAITLGIMLSIPFLLGTLSSSKQVLGGINERNNLVAEVLKVHPVTTLVGDYWRVIPIKRVAGNNLVVTPLQSCTTARDILTSTTWQPHLATHSFAYLLSLDSSATGYPHCSLGDITGTYGKPNASTVIKGTLENPQELLLFYDHGTHKPTNRPLSSASPDTVVPTSMQDLRDVTCNQPTIMNFVAHQDDDLLFMNPDLLHDVQANHCIRTVYFTAGDAGSNAAYWLGRQKAAEAAYDSMLGKPNQIWIEKVVKLSTGHFATIANPKSNHYISLIFLHLPDGNLFGAGFKNTHHESLKELYNGKIPVLKTVDESSSYTSTQLTDTLTGLMQTYQPTKIRSQSSYVGPAPYQDHSDHTNVALYTTRAYNLYMADRADKNPTPITYYLGYPIRTMSANVSGGDLDNKTATFLMFGKFDTAVCHSVEECGPQSAYGSYLRRQYTYAR